MAAANQRSNARARQSLPMEVVGRRSALVARLTSALEHHGIVRPEPRSRVAGTHGTVLPRRRPRELGAPGRAPHYEPGPGGGLCLVNALKPDGTTDVAEMRRKVQAIRGRDPYVPIFVLLDERDPDAVRAARLAGATHYLGATAASNGEAAAWRVADVLERESAAGAVPAEALAADVHLTPFEEPSPQEVEAARARARAGLASLVPPARAAAYAAALLSIDAADLRDPASGRLDARRVAERLGVSVSRLAGAAGVSQQALSARPDSLRAQAGLLQVARVLAALDEIVPRGEHAMWLRTPRARFGRDTPLEMLIDGRAEALARELEGALEGLPG